MDENYLTVDEAASVLKVDPETVRRWLNAGRLKGVKPAGQWRIAESDLQDFLKPVGKE